MLFRSIPDNEVERWAKQEMSYYLFSKPDEFPSKELAKESMASKKPDTIIPFTISIFNLLTIIATLSAKNIFLNKPKTLLGNVR